MIPEEITRKDILKAIDEISRDDFPAKHGSTKWDLVDDEGRTYPPKWAIRIAGRYALGEEHSDKLFSGGPETNNFLRARGFQIIPKLSKFSAHSWTVENSYEAYKVLDKSAFINRGTVVPVEVRPFFIDGEMSPGETLPITLVYAGKEYNARIDRGAQDSATTRLFWKGDFINLLKELFPHHHALFSRDIKPESDIALKFTRLLNNERFKLTFIGEVSDRTINDDIDADVTEDQGPQTEGGVREYFGKRYERNPRNRKEAIRIHGLSCNVCGFNFEQVYGARGADYIEVHHVKPIHTFKEEQHVDPETDLTTVCSNCHRMMHRKKANILTVEELKELILEMRPGA